MQPRLSVVALGVTLVLSSCLLPQFDEVASFGAAAGSVSGAGTASGAAGGGGGVTGVAGGVVGAGADPSGGAGGSAAGASGAHCLDTKSDRKNCGWCGHDCGAAACVQGLCNPEQLAVSTGVPADLLIEGTLRVWTSSSGVHSQRDSLSEVSRPLLLAKRLARAPGRWLVATGGDGAQDGIYSFDPSTAKAPERLVGGGRVEYVAVVGEYVWWSECPSTGPYKLLRVPLAGPYDAELVATTTYCAYGFGAYGDWLWIVGQNGSLYRLPLTVTAPATPELQGKSDSDSANSFVMDGSRMVFASRRFEYDGNSIEQKLPDTISTVDLVRPTDIANFSAAEVFQFVTDLALHQGVVYVADRGKPVEECPLGSIRSKALGARTDSNLLANNEPCPNAVAADGDYSYWLAGSSGTSFSTLKRVRH